MEILIDVIGLIDRELGIKEDRHKVRVILENHSWEQLDWESRAFFLDELTDVVRHSLTKYGQVEYTIHANQTEGLEYDDIED